MVVVIGIISSLMAIGIPGIVSQIKRADLYNTTNIIATLHSFCYTNAKQFDGVALPTAVYQLTIKQDKVVFSIGGATVIPSYEIGKQFAFTTDGSLNAISFEDSFKPEKYRIYTLTGSPPDWRTSGGYTDITASAFLDIQYQPRTGFVMDSGSTIAKIELLVKDAKGKRYTIIFWPTGAINVKSG